MADQINISADFSDIIDKFAKLHGIQGKARKELEDYIKATATYDEAGKRQASTVKIQINETQDFVGTMKEVVKTIDGAKVATEQYRFTIVNTNREVQRQKRLAKEAAAAQKEAAKLQREADQQARAAARAQAQAQREAERQTRAAEKALRDQARAAERLKQQEVNRLKNDLNKLGVGSSGGGGPGPNDSQIAKAQKYTEILGRMQATLTNLAIYRGFNILTNQLTQSVSAAQELQIKISLIRTVSQSAQQTFSQWGRDIRDVSAQSGIAATEVADAFNDIVQNQLASGAGVKQLAQQAADFARVTGSQVRDAGNILGSVLNTYGTEAGNVDEISAKLFKTIDRGRIITSELANGFGNVAFLAKDLGVEFEELLAALASLTRSGLSTDEAMTLINNGIVKLLKPTDAMKAAFGEMGVASGRFAVQSKGLLGTLAEIDRLVSQGKIDPTAAFDEIRGQKFFAFYNQNVDKIKEDQREIATNSATTFNNAKQIRSESDADKIAKAVTSAQNAIQGSFGDAVTQLLAQLADLNSEAIELEKTFSKWGKGILAVAGAIGTGVIALKALAISQELNVIRAQKSVIAEKQAQLAKVQTAAATDRLTQAELRLAAAQQRAAGGRLVGVAAANPLGAALTVGLTAFTAFEIFRETSTSAFDEAAEAVKSLAQQLKDGAASQAVDNFVAETEKIRDNFKEAAKIVNNELTEALQRNNRALASIRENITASQDRLRSGFVGVLDIARNKVQDLERGFGAIPGRIEAARQAQVEFAETIRNLKLDAAREFATPTQNIELTQNEIARINREIESLAGDSSERAMDRTEKLFAQLAQLTKQLRVDEFTLAKDQQIEQLNARGATGHFQFTFDNASLNKELDAIEQRRLGWMQRQTAELEKQHKLKEIEVAKSKENLALVEKTVAGFLDFNVNDKRFQTVTGQFDPNKAREGFAQQISDLRNLVPADVLQSLNFDQAVDIRQKQLELEITRTTQGQEINKAQENQLKASKRVTELTSQHADQLKRAADAAQGIGQNSIVLAKTLEEAAKKFPALLKTASDETQAVGSLPRGINRVSNEFNEFLGIKPAGIDTTELDQIAATAADIRRKIFETINTPIERDGQKIIDLDRLKQLQTELAGLSTKFSEVRQKFVDKEFGKAGEGSVSTRTAKEVEVFIDAINNAGLVFEAERKKLDEAIVAYAQAFQTQKQLQEAQAQVTASANSVKGTITQTFTSLGGVAGGFATQLEIAKNQLDGLATAADKANKVVQSIKTNTEQAAQNAAQALGGASALIPREAYGGPIRRAYGGPIGKDNIMAWLQDGEYIMNAAATKRFYSQIVTHNNMGRVPQYFNKGGEVTNMGGVTINVNGAENPSVVGREVNRVLQRTKRMGQTR